MYRKAFNDGLSEDVKAKLKACGHIDFEKEC